MVDETTEKEEKKPKKAKADNDIGDKSEAISLIEQANAAAERLEQANAQTVEIMARGRLGGKSEGKPIEAKKEETAKEYAERAIANKL